MDTCSDYSFNVHKANLICASPVFSDVLGMGVCGDGSVESVALVEPDEVVKRFLPFIYATIPSNYEVDLPRDSGPVEALRKYEVGAMRPGGCEVAVDL